MGLYIRCINQSQHLIVLENDGTVIGWNLPPLDVNTVYSIILLLPKASEAEWIEPVYLNVKRTGEGKATVILTYAVNI